jgi:hypothetical protein
MWEGYLLTDLIWQSWREFETQFAVIHTASSTESCERRSEELMACGSPIGDNLEIILKEVLGTATSRHLGDVYGQYVWLRRQTMTKAASAAGHIVLYGLLSKDIHLE